MATRRYQLPQGRMDALTPLGQAVNNLATVFMQMPTREERAFNQSRADAAASEAEINRGRLTAASSIEDVFRRSLSPPPGVDPEAHYRTMLPEIARTAAQAQQYGQIGDLGRVIATSIAGATPQLQSNAMLGAGQAMSATPVGFSTDQRRQEREAGARNATTLAASRYATDRAAATQDRIDARNLAVVEDENGRPVYVPRTEAVGRRPAATPVLRSPANSFVLAQGPNGERRSLRADDPQADELARQGWTITGASVQAQTPDQLSATDRSREETTTRSREAALRMLQRAWNLSGDPRNFGAAGTFRGFVQDATQQAQAIAQMLSPEAAQRVQAITSQAGAAAQTPGFDPAIPQLNMVLQILPYQLAEAVAQQSGRGLSNNDVARWERIVGSLGPVANQAEFRARVEELASMVRDEINISRRSRQQPEIGPDQWFRGGATPGPAAPQQPAAAPPRRIRLVPQ